MKKIYKPVIAFIFVFLLAYAGLWIYTAQWFSKEIDTLYASAQKDSIKLLGEKPTLSNFPFVPELHYTNGIEAGNIKILFPRLLVRGYPLPYANLKLSFPDGVSLGGLVNPKIWNLNTLTANIVIPYHLPNSFYEEDLTAWKKNGGKLNVKNYDATKGVLIVKGHGLLSIDDKLQPIFNFISVLKNYDSFMIEEKQKGLIDPFAAAIGMTILNGLSKVDAVTDEKTVTLNINVENQMLSVGPIRALPLPLIVWDKHMPPVPHQ